MGLIRNRINERFAVGFGFFVLGGMFGFFVPNVPYLVFDKQVDTASLISIASLVVAVFVMPFIVDRMKDRKSSIDKMAASDLDDACLIVQEIRAVYDNMSPESSVSSGEYAKLLSMFKRVGSLLSALSREFEDSGVLRGFKGDVITDTFLPVRIACTDKLRRDRPMQSDDIEQSQVELDRLFNNMKIYKYRLYRGGT